MSHTNIVEILLVEDNQRDAELIIHALEKHKSPNQLVHVKDGTEALDFLFGRGQYAGRNIEQRPRVVLLDLGLPKLNGLDVLRAIKADEVLRCLPVVIVTSSDDASDIQTAYDLGANSYVVKPMEFDAFIKAMRHLGLYWLQSNQPLK
jgi:two-component system response regulator